MLLCVCVRAFTHELRVENDSPNHFTTGSDEVYVARLALRPCHKRLRCVQRSGAHHASKSTKGRTSLYIRNPCDVIQMFGLQRAQRYFTTSLAAAGTMPTPSDGIVSRYRPDPGPRTRARGGWHRVRCRLICMEFAQLCPILLQVIRYSM